MVDVDTAGQARQPLAAPSGRILNETLENVATIVIPITSWRMFLFVLMPTLFFFMKAAMRRFKVASKSNCITVSKPTVSDRHLCWVCNCTYHHKGYRLSSIRHLYSG